MTGSGLWGYSMVLPLLSGEAAAALRIGVWTSQKQRVGEELMTPLIPASSPQRSSHSACLSPSHPESPLERKEGTWVSLVPYLWRQPAGF